MREVLIPEALLQTKDAEIRRLIAQSREEYTVDVDDPDYGPAFRRYLAFSSPSAVRATLGLPSLDQARVLYNRYYWFHKFMLLCRAKCGPNIGMEQMEFKLLENATCDFDWSIMEAISKLGDAEVEAYLKHARGRMNAPPKR